MTPEHIQFLARTISADSLWLFLRESRDNNEGASVIRLGDGERALLAHLRGAAAAPFLRSTKWLNEYGLTDAYLFDVAAGLNVAQKRASWVGPSPSGVINPQYDLLPFLAPRSHWAPCYYAAHWAPCGRHVDLLSGLRVALCTRHAADRAPALQQNILAEIIPVEVGNWRDHARARQAVNDAGCRAAIISAGPAGKLLTVNLGRDGLLALDIGSRLALWTT